MNLRSMIQKGPGQLIEFVRDADVDQLAESLAAFANADGGTILVGVSASGRFGRLDPDELDAALRSAEQRCAPPVKAEWQATETPDGALVAVTVPRSSEVHTLDDGRVLLRSGRKNLAMGGEQIRQLAVARGGPSFELETVAGATRDDLDQYVIDQFKEQRLKRAARGERLEGDELLFSTRAIDREGNVTVAGMLLFGKRPQDFLPQSGVVFVRFPGTSVTGGGDAQSYARREEINGPLNWVIEETWELLWDAMPKKGVVNGLRREDKPAYPEVAVREALVNAVAHREYRLAGRRIEVRLFDDRLEILSPGGLPGHITLDNIVEEHFSRNPFIVRGLYYWGFIEELGIGVDRMIETMVKAGHDQPKFDPKPQSFGVTLLGEQRKPQRQWPGTMSERQLRALRYVEENGRITNREYRELCPDLSSETVRLDLVDMVNRGLLLKIGEKRSTFYILK